VSVQTAPMPVAQRAGTQVAAAYAEWKSDKRGSLAHRPLYVSRAVDALRPLSWSQRSLALAHASSQLKQQRWVRAPAFIASVRAELISSALQP